MAKNCMIKKSLHAPICVALLSKFYNCMASGTLTCMHAASLEQLEEEFSSPYVYSHDMYYMLYNQIDSIYMSYNILRTGEVYRSSPAGLAKLAHEIQRMRAHNTYGIRVRMNVRVYVRNGCMHMQIVRTRTYYTYARIYTIDPRAHAQVSCTQLPRSRQPYTKSIGLARQTSPVRKLEHIYILEICGSKSQSYR